MPPNSLGQANDERRRCNDCRQSQGLISQDAQFDTSKGRHKINQEQPDRLAIPYIHIHQVAPEHLARDCEVECFVDMQDWITKCRSPHNKGRQRSEEHTSELQSLMRRSYAVFCLNKKNNIKYKNIKN